MPTFDVVSTQQGCIQGSMTFKQTQYNENHVYTFGRVKIYQQ